MVSVTHSFVSAVPDDADATLVRPQIAWNAEHVVTGVREQLTEYASRYLRYNLGRCTMTIATPAVVTSVAHGLQVDDPVIFNLPYDCPQDDIAVCTISIATPGVVTVDTNGNYPGHGFENDDPVSFWSTGALPTGITANTPDVVTTYYVRNKTDTTFEISLTAGGASIDTSGSQSGFHKFERASWLPTGVTEGQVYYITSVPTADTFQFSATLGGAAVNTTGTQAGKITLATGNSANDGLTLSRSGALLYPQDCIKQAQQYDFCGRMLHYQIADGTYLPDPDSGFFREDRNLTMYFPVPNVIPTDDLGESWPIGGGRVMFLGNTNFKNNVIWRAPDAPNMYLAGPLPWNLQIRKVTFDTGYYNHFNLDGEAGGENGFYFDHLGFRATGILEWVLENRGFTTFIHGSTDLFCAPAYMLSYTIGKSAETSFQDGGGQWPQGIAAWTPQSYIDAMFYGTEESKTYVASVIRIIGSYTGAPWEQEYGATFITNVNTGERTHEIPGTLPPVIGIGSWFQAADRQTSGLAAVVRPDEHTKRVAADFPKTNDTLANVTGLSIPLVQSGISYKIDATIYTTSDVAAGIKFALSGTATVADLILEAEVKQGTSIVVNERATALNSTFGDITAVTTATVKITGSFTSTTTHGFLTLQFAQNVTNASASNVLEGSTFSATPIY